MPKGFYTTKASVRQSQNDQAFADENPFRSMYQQTVGKSAQLRNKEMAGSHQQMQKHASQTFYRTPEKTAAPRGVALKQHNDFAHLQLSMTPQGRRVSCKSATRAHAQPIAQEGSRKFGAYLGSEEVFPTNATLYSQMTPEKGQKRKRCTDRFVKYPYPKAVRSNYKQDYYDKKDYIKAVRPKEAFNIEKEHKIINKHKMDLSTTCKDNFKEFKVTATRKSVDRVAQQPAPILGTSAYANQYPNWQNGKNDVYIEKHPQFPVYSLPFHGDSSYKKNFTEEQMKEMRRQQKLLEQREARIEVPSYMPQHFQFETTNQKNYKPFQVVQRPQTSKPKVECVQTHSFKQHFDTNNKKCFRKPEHRVHTVDLIPYP